MVEEPETDAVLDLGDGVAELLRDSLALERLDCVRVCLGWHDDERDNSHGRARGFEAVVEARKRLYEHIHTLVAVLISAGSEHLRNIKRGSVRKFEELT